nr:hypothetical protein [Tanacetum cinerariifolium]
MMAVSKVPMLKPVIENGATLLKTQVVEGVTTVMPITTVEEKAYRRIEMTWKLIVNGNKTIGFDKSNLECYNCHKRGHFARECRAPKNPDNKHKESTRKSVSVETPNSIDLVSCDGLGGYDWSDQVEEGPNYALMAFISLSFDSKKSELMVLGYKTGLESVEERLKFFKTNESIFLEDIKVLKVEIQMKDIAIRELRKMLVVAQKEKNGVQLTVDNLKMHLKIVVENKSSEEETNSARKDALIIKEWLSDNEEENVSQPKLEKKIVRPSIIYKEFVKPRQQEKTARKTVKKVEHNRKNTHTPRGNQRN